MCSFRRLEAVLYTRGRDECELNPDNLPIVPHSHVGDEDCCGCLMPVERGDQADLVCNECGALIQTVPIAQVEPTLLNMAMSLRAIAVTGNCLPIQRW